MARRSADPDLTEGNRRPRRAAAITLGADEDPRHRTVPIVRLSVRYAAWMDKRVKLWNP